MWRQEQVDPPRLEFHENELATLLNWLGMVNADWLLNYQNAYDHQTFQGGDMLQGALTHIYAWHLNRMIL